MSSLERLAVPRRQRVFNRKLMPLGEKLPFWASMSLDSKIPVAPSPRGSYTFFTTELGQPKYVSKQQYDFDLTDPLGYAMTAEYDSLQDPYLKRFFLKPPTKRHIRNNGLITPDDKIVCNVKEFNKYREYLRHRSVTDFNLKRRRSVPVLREDNDRKQERAQAKCRSRKTYSEYNMRDPDDHSRSSMLKARLDSLSNSLSQSDSLIDKLKTRESLLSLRLEEKRLQQMALTERRIKESWEERKKRQQQMLDRESEIENLGLRKRREQLEKREHELARNREQQMARLEKIKAEYLHAREKKFGKTSREPSTDRSIQSKRTIDTVAETSNKQTVTETSNKPTVTDTSHNGTVNATSHKGTVNATSHKGDNPQTASSSKGDETPLPQESSPQPKAEGDAEE